MAIPAIVYFDKDNQLAVNTYHELISSGEIDINSIDRKMLIAIGGDGTLIRAIHEYPNMPDGFSVGLIGTGTINYLAMGNNPVKHTVHMINCIADKYGVDQDFAMNEIAIKAEDDARMLKFDVYIDSELVCENVRGDGIIVATAVGSTAYAMSAGGPIIDIGTPVNVIVMNNEYSRKSRPIVLSNDRTITIVPKDDFIIYMDGLNNFECEANERVEIFKGKSITLWHANSLVREEKNR